MDEIEVEKPARRWRIGIGGGIAIAILALWAGLAVFRSEPPRRTIEEYVEKQLLEHPRDGKVFVALKRTYPEEFAALKRMVIARTAAGLKPPEIADATLDFLVATAERHRKSMAQAPHAQFAAYRRAEIDLVQALAEQDPGLCASYVLGGTLRRLQGNEVQRTAVALQAASWEASAAGRDTPAGRRIGLPSTVEVDKVAEEMLRDGLAPHEVDLFFSKRMARAEPALQCRAGLGFYRAIDALPGDVGDRIYAYMVMQPH